MRLFVDVNTFHAMCANRGVCSMEVGCCSDCLYEKYLNLIGGQNED